MEDTLARALQCAGAGLSRIAAQLAAESVAVSLHAGGRSIAHIWSSTGAAERHDPPRRLIHRTEAIEIILGFSDGRSAPGRLPDALAADLDLIAWAFWSAHEAGKLRAQLKAANERLASRKLVERAKGLLQMQRGITEDSAYAFLRGQSRSRRITLARVAAEIVRANGSSLS
jgi:ANTAR domain